MNLARTKLVFILFYLLVWLIITYLLLVPLIALANARTLPTSHPSTSGVAFPPGTSIISGTYAGAASITEPVKLGVLDLAFDLTDHNGTLTGAIVPSRTLVFSGTPALSGGITGSVNGITPTFTLNSAVFTGTVAGRAVQRQVTLAGEVWQDGDVLTGIYTEVVGGLIPEPLTTRGIFLVTRAAQTIQFVPQSRLLLQVSPASVQPNGIAAVLATLLNDKQQPIDNAQVTFSSDKGTFSPAVAQTNSNGVASTSFTASPTPGRGTITATSDGMVGTRSIFVTNGSLTLEAEADHLKFDAQTVLTATLRDLSNNPVGGQVISFTARLGSVSPITGVTTARGQVMATFTAGNLPGEAKVYVDAGTIAATRVFTLAGQ
jgi:hypothetical protein